MGWDVHLVTSPGPELDEHKIQNYARCHEIRMKRGPALSDGPSLIKWISLLAKIRPDVISAGTPKAGLLGMLAGTIARIPNRIYVLRGLRLENTQGFQLFILEMIEKLTARCATQVLSVSPSLRDLYVSKGLTRPEKIVVLGHGSSKGVDTSRFRPALVKERQTLEQMRAQIGLRPDVPVLGLFGRHTKDKGFPIFFDALRQQELAELPLQILAVGDDESAGSFLSGTDSLAHNFVSLPRAKDLEVYYRMIDVLCLPTLREGMPNVALEAQSSGIPVITTTATGAIDSVEHRRTGILVSKGSVSELAWAIALLVRDKSLRDSLAGNARPWVLDRFTEERVNADHLVFYSALPISPRQSR